MLKKFNSLEGNRLYKSCGIVPKIAPPPVKTVQSENEKLQTKITLKMGELQIENIRLQNELEDKNELLNYYREKAGGIISQELGLNIPLREMELIK